MQKFLPVNYGTMNAFTSSSHQKATLSHVGTISLQIGWPYQTGEVLLY